MRSGESPTVRVKPARLFQEIPENTTRTPPPPLSVSAPLPPRTPSASPSTSKGKAPASLIELSSDSEDDAGQEVKTDNESPIQWNSASQDSRASIESVGSFSSSSWAMPFESSFRSTASNRSARSFLSGSASSSSSFVSVSPPMASFPQTGSADAFVNSGSGSGSDSTSFTSTSMSMSISTGPRLARQHSDTPRTSYMNSSPSPMKFKPAGSAPAPSSSPTKPQLPQPSPIKPPSKGKPNRDARTAEIQKYLLSPTDDDDGQSSTPPPSSPSPSLSQASAAGLQGAGGTQAPVPTPPPVDAVMALALEKLVNSPLGVDLQECVIAHDKDVQKQMDDAGLAWSVQWAIARGIGEKRWTWADVESKITALKGSNKEVGYRVGAIILDKERKGSTDLAVWEELDREQAAIIENQGRGLGLMGEWHGVQNWYGGRVQQVARLTKRNGKLEIQLGVLEKRRSYRLSRFLGSRRVVQVKVPDELALKNTEDVKKFFLQKFVVCGRVFVPLCSKDNGVYMVETDQDYERVPRVSEGDQHRMGEAEIVQWHNDLALNQKQPMSKWVTRFALMLSTSVPVLLFDEENIHSIPDEYSSSWDGRSKPSSEQTMTDGCGLINRAALRMISDALGTETCMSAVQGRIKGGKGLWILHHSNTDTEPQIWIRDSQQKIVYEYPLDRSHRILDLLTISRSGASSGLTKQSIMLAWHNGVPKETLIEMMESGIREAVEPLMRWEGPHAMVGLYDAIDRTGNVSKGRKIRAMAELSRALGLQKREWGHEDIGMEKEQVEGGASQTQEWTVEDELSQATYTGRNEISGAPLSVHENAMELVQAGFRPDQLPQLRDKLKNIIKTSIIAGVERFVIPLLQSASAFIIPDPLGVLEEGEVYYRSSQPLLDPESRTYYNIMTGSVLIGRYPVRLGSDIQKVTAVDKRELFNWPDVLIVSIKGEYSQASILSGGDYDGDEVFIIKDPRIVEPFESKPLFEMPKNLMRDNFESQVESVTSFAQRVTSLPPREAQLAFQEVILLGLSHAQVGMYSRFHDFAVWKYGLDDPQAVRLAYIFNAVLDSSKTGNRLKPGIYDQDRRRFNGDVPVTSEGLPQPNAGPFIFHSLYEAGERMGINLMSKYDYMAGTGDVKQDAALLEPYDTASAHANDVFRDRNDRTFTDELAVVREHVNRALAEWEKVVAAKRDPASPSKKRKRQRAESDPMSKATQVYAEDVPKDRIVFYRNIGILKASYAYHRKPNFALSVAFRDVCDIKAHASKGGIAPVVRSIDEAKTVSRGYMKGVNGVSEGL